MTLFSRMIAASLLTAFAAPAMAQPPSTTPLSLDTPVKAAIGAAAPVDAAGAHYDCYALGTSPGEALRLSMQAPSDAAKLVVARGANCATAAAQYFKAGQNPVLSMKASGGRYFVLAFNETGAPYTLTASRVSVEPGPAGQGTLAAAEPGATSGTTTTAPSFRRELMDAQVQKRRAEIAAAQERARAQAQAAERQARLARLEAEAREAEMAAQAQAEDDEPTVQQPSFAELLYRGLTTLNEELDKGAQQRAQQDSVIRGIERQAEQTRQAQQARQRAQQAREQLARTQAAERAQQSRAEQQLAEARQREQRVLAEQRAREQQMRAAAAASQGAAGGGSATPSATGPSSAIARGSSTLPGSRSTQASSGGGQSPVMGLIVEDTSAERNKRAAEELARTREAEAIRQRQEAANREAAAKAAAEKAREPKVKRDRCGIPEGKPGYYDEPETKNGVCPV